MNSLAIEQSDKYFRLLAENAIVGVFILSKECEFIFINDFLSSLFGYHKQQLLSINIHDIILKEDREQCNKAFSSVFSKEKDGFQIESRYLKKNNDFLWCEMSISANRNSNGEITFLTGIINDISNRKRVENQLLDSQRLFSSVFKN